MTTAATIIMLAIAAINTRSPRLGPASVVGQSRQCTMGHALFCSRCSLDRKLRRGSLLESCLLWLARFQHLRKTLCIRNKQ